MIASRGMSDGGSYIARTPCLGLHRTQEARRLSGSVCPGLEKLIVQLGGTSGDPRGYTEGSSPPGRMSFSIIPLGRDASRGGGLSSISSVAPL